VAGRPSDQLTLAVQRIQAFNAAALVTDHKRQLQVSGCPAGCVAGCLAGCLAGRGAVVIWSGTGLASSGAGSAAPARWSSPGDWSQDSQCTSAHLHSHQHHLHQQARQEGG
jgi:hypothetical protein